MSGKSFTSATVDIKDVEHGLDAMERRARALGPAFSDLKRPMRDDQKDHGKRQRGPIGAWARRSPRTLAAYRASGRRRLPRPLGKLLSAVSYAATPYSVAAESRVLWSGAHQDGATVGRGVKLRARPFLWISARLLEKADQIFESALLSAYGGGR